MQGEARQKQTRDLSMKNGSTKMLVKVAAVASVSLAIKAHKREPEKLLGCQQFVNP